MGEELKEKVHQANSKMEDTRSILPPEPKASILILGHFQTVRIPSVNAAWDKA